MCRELIKIGCDSEVALVIAIIRLSLKPVLERSRYKMTKRNRGSN